MKIIKSITSKFSYAFTYEYNTDVLMFCRTLKEKYGYRTFGWHDKAWRFNDLNIVNDIQNRFPSAGVDANMYDDMKLHKINEEKEAIREKRAEELKVATEASITINNLKAPLYPYQSIGVEFFINNNGKAILADTMGLGKTVQSLAYIVHTKQEKTLVVCPASVKYVWKSEIEKWTKLRPCVINSKTGLDDKAINDHDIFIINYDIVKKFFGFLSNKRIDCGICDEFHYIKNSTAQRTKVTKALIKNCKSVLLLSGTPLLSRPAELFNGLNLMDPLVWNDWYKFTQRYCNGHQGRFGYDYKGSSNIGELQERIGKYFLRRTKEEVLKELPPKRFINLPTTLEPIFQRQYDMAEKDLVIYLKEIKKKKDGAIKRSMQAEKLVRLNELRQITTKGKIYAAKDAIDSIVDSGEKVVVFSAFNEPLTQLHEKYKDSSVLLTGGTSEIKRKNIIEKFQNDDKTKIFLGGLKSAGVGITLTAASNVLTIDLSWVPADHWQAHDRIHRIGQEADVITIYQLFAKGTIDEYMSDMLIKKQEIFDKLINQKVPDSGKSQGGMLNDVVKHLENK